MSMVRNLPSLLSFQAQPTASRQHRPFSAKALLSTLLGSTVLPLLVSGSWRHRLKPRAISQEMPPAGRQQPGHRAPAQGRNRGHCSRGFYPSSSLLDAFWSAANRRERRRSHAWHCAGHLASPSICGELYGHVPIL